MNCPKCGFDNPERTTLCKECGAPLSPQDKSSITSTKIMISPPLQELTPGTTFARRYNVVEELGRGGMGRVYKVFDIEVREKIALKLLNTAIASDEQMIDRFRNELKLTRTISHRNICRMYDLGREQGTYYITMEYVPGEDLKSLIHRIGVLTIGKAVSIALQVCNGLEEAHRGGVVHRDLKPQNIMIDREGNVRIMDFGIARSVETKEITEANVLIGTPEYMSPEQVDGKDVDQRSDIYSLGIVLFEMLTGRLPFEGKTLLSVAVKQKNEAPPDPRKINPLIPDDLKQLVLKCLDKSREKRYQGAEALSLDLAEIEKKLPTATQPLAIRKPRTSRQITVPIPSKKIWIPAAVAFIAVLAFVLWQFVPQRESAKRSIAVLGFRNQTADSAYDYLQETIPNLLITSLEQSGRFHVITWQRLKDLFRKTGHEGNAFLDEEAGFEMCRKEGIEALALGFYTKAGEIFETDVKVLDTATKQLLKTAQASGEGPDSILRTQIDKIGRSISRGIGLPVLKIDKRQPKVVDITTSSLDAYNFFLRGRDELERYYYSDAKRSLEKAIDLDPTFAIAYLYLSKTAHALSDFKTRDNALEKAKQNAARATEKDRLYIDANYASVIQRNQDEYFRLLKKLTKKYPAEKAAYMDLGVYYRSRALYADALSAIEKAIDLDPNFGNAFNAMAFIYVKMRNFEKALSYYERYAAINPRDPNPLDSIADLYMHMGKLDESAAKYNEVLAAYPDFYFSYESLAYIFALQENYAEANRCLEEFIARAPTASAKAEGIWLRAYFRYFLGRWDQSLADYLSIKKQYEKIGEEFFSAVVDWISGHIYSDRGDFDLARRAFNDWTVYAMKKNPASLTFTAASQSYYRGWVDFKQGRLESARAALGETESLLSGVDSTNRDNMTLLFQLLAADVALARNSGEEAIAIGEKIFPLDFGFCRTLVIANYNTPFLKDVLARAYWKKGDLDKAATEYSKLMTINPADQVRYLIHPLYHYRLGRVFEEKGDKEKARLQYKKFLECWRDADVNHPELADARNRLAVLR